MKPISNREFKRRVFNEAFLTGLSKIHGDILNSDNSADGDTTKMADALCHEFFKQSLDLNTNTISKTKDKLTESVTYIKDLINISEAIATDKAKIAADNDMELNDEQPIELNKEDESLLNTLFDNKKPQLQVDKVRDATVKALLAEDKKAEEIKNAIDIAKSDIKPNMQTTDDANKTLKETITRLNQRGPTSLMNSIMNSMSVAAIGDITKSGNFKSVRNVMKENADDIKTRSVMVYSLYEMASVFGIQHYTSKDIEKISKEIYYGK